MLPFLLLLFRSHGPRDRPCNRPDRCSCNRQGIQDKPLVQHPEGMDNRQSDKTTKQCAAKHMYSIHRPFPFRF